MENNTVKKASKLIERKSNFQMESKKKSTMHIIEDDLETKNNINKYTLDIECIIPEKQRKSKSKSKKVMKKSDLNTDNSNKKSKIIVENNGKMPKMPKIDSKNKIIKSSENILNPIVPKNMLDIPIQSKLKIQIPVEDAEKEDMIKKSNIPHSKVGKNGEIIVPKKEFKKKFIIPTSASHSADPKST